MTLDPLGRAFALSGMTQQKWQRLSQSERERLRDPSELIPEFVGREGWRVEVVDSYGETRRFIIGVSMGWRPSHLEISRRNSSGGRTIRDGLSV